MDYYVKYTNGNTDIFNNVTDRRKMFRLISRYCKAATLSEIKTCFKHERGYLGIKFYEPVRVKNIYNISHLEWSDTPIRVSKIYNQGELKWSTV